MKVQRTCFWPLAVEITGLAALLVLTSVTVEVADVPAIGSVATTVAASPVVAATFSLVTT